MSKLIIKFFLGFFILIFITPSSAQTTEQDYPKIMGMNIGSPTTYDNPLYLQRMSKVDVLVMNFWPHWKENKYGKNSIKNTVDKIKILNPNILIGQYTILGESQDTKSKDTSNADRAKKIEHQNWWLRDSTGNKLQWTGQYDAWDTNITDSTTPDEQGMRYPQWLAHRNYKLFFKDTPDFEFWFLDNSMNQSPVDKADWFLEGRNRKSSDLDVAQAYRKGHVEYWDTIKTLQPNTLLMANSDNIASAEYSHRLNGAFLEALIGKRWSVESRNDWSTMMERYYSFIENTLPPKLVGFNVWGKPDNYQRMRYGLASCLMNDGYFSYTDEITGYGWVAWFDEFDINLGQPIEPPPVSAWQNGVFKRLFENGMAIVNPTSTIKTVQIDPGFKKIKGVQAPIINDGKPVELITLQAKDGVILIR